MITLIAEVKHVSGQLVADRNIAIYPGPRILRDLYDTLFVMSGEMVVARTNFYDTAMGSDSLDEKQQSLLSASDCTSRTIVVFQRT